jgi:hypothetical protein
MRKERVERMSTDRENYVSSSNKCKYEYVRKREES